MTRDMDDNRPPDYLLIGAGIMSATFGAFIKLLNPEARILILERLDAVALESSDAWNNAGTGHAAFCELNYTPRRKDGSVDCQKAFLIDEQFELSKQFWAFLVRNGSIDRHFIRSLPHMSFVHGAEDVDFLKRRVATLRKNALFAEMQYSEDPELIARWVPLMMKDRKMTEPIAMTRMDMGTDVDFGRLTRSLFAYLEQQPHVTLLKGVEVDDIDPVGETGMWRVEAHEMKEKKKLNFTTPFVFIGAGGGALPLLEKSRIPEAKGYGGFPVSGRWLRCHNPKVIAQHHAKVYGKAGLGAPPMSVPHLDTRHINGEKQLLFGPYAGFSTKFLKHGSYFDLPASLRLGNIIPMVQAGIDNRDLTRYLIRQVMQSPEDRLATLQTFYPDARLADWDLAIAGQRVQIIKDDPEEGGILEFGTEIVHNQSGSLAALLGASPGASTAVYIVLQLLEKCFASRLAEPGWQHKLKEMIPSYGKSLIHDGRLALQTRWNSHRDLGLKLPAMTDGD